MRITLLGALALLLSSAEASATVITMPEARAEAPAGFLLPRHEASRELSRARRPRRRRNKARRSRRRGKEAARPAAARPADDTPTLPPLPPLPKRYTAVAVVPVVGLDVTDEILRAIEQAIMNEIDETAGMRAVSPTDVQNDIGGLGLDPEKCGSDTACLARCGRYARTQRLLEARVASLGGTLSLSMRLIDTEAGRELARVADPLADDADARARDIHRLAVQLLAPDSYVGNLTVVSSTEGAEVYLDDRLVGTTPLPGPLEELPAGPHILRVTKTGFTDLYQFVDVVYRRNSTITVDMDRNTISGVIAELESEAGFGALYIAASEPGVEVRIDGEPVGVTPLDAAVLKVAAGKRRISLRKPGREPRVLEVDIEADRRLDIAVEVEADGMRVAATRNSAAEEPLPSYAEIVAATGAEPSASQAPGQGPPLRLIAGIVAAGAGIAGLGASTYYGLQVADLKKKAAAKAAEWNLEANHDLSYSDYEAITGALEPINAEGKSAALKEWIFLGVGAGLLAAGSGLLAWYLLAPATPGEPEPRADAGGLALDVVPLAGGGGLVLSGRF